MRNVVIVDGLRTPFGRLGGGLKQFYNSDMGAIVIRALLEKNALDPKEVDAVLSAYQNPPAFDPGASTRGLYLRGLE